MNAAGLTAANIGKKSAAPGLRHGVKLPPLLGRKAETRRKWSGFATYRLPLRKIVAMPLITFQKVRGCGKSTQVKRSLARLRKTLWDQHLFSSISEDNSSI